MTNAKLVQQGERRRQEIVAFIRSYVAARRIAPTVGEIAAGVGLASTSATKAHLDRLQRDGVISMIPGSPRSIVVEDG